MKLTHISGKGANLIVQCQEGQDVNSHICFVHCCYGWVTLLWKCIWNSYIIVAFSTWWQILTSHLVTVIFPALQREAVMKPQVLHASTFFFLLLPPTHLLFPSSTRATVHLTSPSVSSTWFGLTPGTWPATSSRTPTSSWSQPWTSCTGTAKVGYRLRFRKK